jgi:hypothetical protein
VQRDTPGRIRNRKSRQRFRQNRRQIQILPPGPMNRPTLRAEVRSTDALFCQVLRQENNGVLPPSDQSHCPESEPDATDWPI